MVPCVLDDGVADEVADVAPEPASDKVRSRERVLPNKAVAERTRLKYFGHKPVRSKTQTQIKERKVS